MILDNADDIDMFRELREDGSQDFKTPQHAITLSGYIPQTATGSVLITTRDRRAASLLSGGYEGIIPVEMMDGDEAKRLLKMRIPPSLSIDLDLEHLVRELEYLPLAITQAAAYISARATRMTVSKYLTLYRQGEANQRRLLDEDSGDLRRDQGVPNSVIRTWQISFDQIKRTSPRSAELLSLIAILDRQGIPEFLLAATNQNPLDFEDAIFPLHEFSFITIEKGDKSFEMHRLVQLATRKWLEQQMDIHRWQEKATKVLSKMFPSGDPRNWGKCETLLPHAREVLKSEPVSDDHFLARASLLYNIAWYNWQKGRYAIAREQIQESLGIRERLLENSHISIFDTVDLLGIVLDEQGKYAEAEAMKRRALAGMETALGPEHPNTLTSLSNLALTLLAQGEYAEAEAMSQRALEGRKTALGPEHPDTLMSLSNVALTLMPQGKYAEAEAMNRRALAGREIALGPEHPNTLMSLSNLATSLYNQNKHAEAETMNRRALAVRETTLGPEHPNTLTSLSNLAGVLHSQGKYAEAEATHRRALAGRETALGPEHPDTLMSVYWLAYLLHSQRKYAEASMLYQRAYNGYQEVLGPSHPTTLACFKNYSRMVKERDKA
jgi:tetratricopeptide (TPR) repeat protein